MSLAFVPPWLSSGERDAARGGSGCHFSFPHGDSQFTVYHGRGTPRGQAIHRNMPNDGSRTCAQRCAAGAFCECENPTGLKLERALCEALARLWPSSLLLPSIPARGLKKRPKILHFLPEDGILESVEAAAIKRAVDLKIIDIVRENDVPKIQMARQMRTSRAALDRLLDPENTSVTLATLTRAAHALGKKVKVDLVSA